MPAVGVVTMGKYFLILQFLVISSAFADSVQELNMACQDARTGGDVSVSAKIYTDKADLIINHEFEMSLQQEGEDENYIGFMEKNNPGNPVFFTADIEPNGERTYRIRFDKSNRYGGCRVSADEIPKIASFNLRPKELSPVEKCANEIDDKVVDCSAGCLQEDDKDFTGIRILGRNGWFYLTAEQAVGISPNWVYGNMKSYTSKFYAGDALQEHEADACEVLERLNKFITENVNL
jgi:hypothetical protein